MSEEETVKISVTIELPKNVYNVLERFAAFVGVPLEEILRQELENDIPGFYQSEIFEVWFRKALRSHGVAEYFQVHKEFGDP